MQWAFGDAVATKVRIGFLYKKDRLTNIDTRIIAYKKGWFEAKRCRRECCMKLGRRKNTQ